MKQLVLLGAMLCLALSSPLQADDAFPGRPKYPDVKIIELADLAKQINEVVMVDVRSEYEFRTLRMQGAINIPVASEDFVKDVANIRTVTKKPIVFYCNGHTCMKSYNAARKANLAKIANCYAFDAGIFDWTVAQPQDAELLGKSPVNPKDLISKSKLKAHQLSPAAFSTRAENENEVMILDVRDRYQRAAVGLFPFQERWAPLDQEDKLHAYVMKAKRSGKTLLVYDEVGKQVRWLQYRLERAGVKKYYFMTGGSKAYFESL